MSDLERSPAPDASGLRYPWPDAPPRGEWREVAEGVVWLRMPLPFALDHINLYLLRQDDGWVIVDTGLGDPGSYEVWERVFAEALGGLPVKAVLCTHFHYDHTGCLGWLADRFRCPVYMSRGEYQALFVDPSRGGEPGWEFYEFFLQAGVPEQRMEQFLRVVKTSKYEGQVPASFIRLQDRQVLRIGSRDWEVVIGAGHSPEHVCLLSRQDKLFISGDQVLPKITSSICITATEPDANPLGEWLQSLRDLKRVPDDVLVLPAHELPFYGLHRRLNELTSHHTTKLASIVEYLASERTIDETTNFLFPHISTPFDLLLANGEARAHLNYLHADEQVSRRLESGCYLYQRLRASELDNSKREVIHV